MPIVARSCVQCGLSKAILTLASTIPDSSKSTSAVEPWGGAARKAQWHIRVWTVTLAEEGREGFYPLGI